MELPREEDEGGFKIGTVIGYMLLGAWILALLAISIFFYLDNEEQGQGIEYALYLFLLIVTVSVVSVHFSDL